jgi:hypothetical protein
MVIEGPKHVASHTIKYDVFDDKYFIILVLNFITSGCLQSNSIPYAMLISTTFTLESRCVTTWNVN